MDRNTEICTENEHGIGKSAEDGKEEAADDTGPYNLEQHLTPASQVGGAEVHQVAVGEDQEEVSQYSGGAGQEPVRLVAGGGSGGGFEADEFGRLVETAIGDETAVGDDGAEEEEEREEEWSVIMHFESSLPLLLLLFSVVSVW